MRRRMMHVHAAFLVNRKIICPTWSTSTYCTRYIFLLHGCLVISTLQQYPRYTKGIIFRTKKAIYFLSKKFNEKLIENFARLFKFLILRIKVKGVVSYEGYYKGTLHVLSD